MRAELKTLHATVHASPQDPPAGAHPITAAQDAAAAELQGLLASPHAKKKHLLF